MQQPVDYFVAYNKICNIIDRVEFGESVWEWCYDDFNEVLGIMEKWADARVYPHTISRWDVVVTVMACNGFVYDRNVVGRLVQLADAMMADITTNHAKTPPCVGGTDDIATRSATRSAKRVPPTANDKEDNHKDMVVLATAFKTMFEW